MALIDRHYLARPYYGSRRMAAWLATQGHLVNRKRVQRLMRLMGPVAIYQRPNTSKAAAAHKIYPYLLGGIAIERVNRLLCSDVTYIPMAKGILSFAVLAWRLFLVTTDGFGRMDPNALNDAMAVDRAQGCIPVMVAATAGTTNAGMIDPLADCGEIARIAGIWYHADAAWGER
jgi:transposase InsO family protein